MGKLRREKESIKRIAAGDAGIEERVESLQRAMTARQADNLCGSKQA